MIVFAAPAQRRPQIGQLVVQPRQPALLVGPGEGPPGALGQVGEVSGVPLLGCPQFAAARQQLDRKLAHGL